MASKALNEQLALKLRQWMATVVPQHSEALTNATVGFLGCFKSGVILCECANVPIIF